MYDGLAGQYRVLAFDGAPGPAADSADEYAVVLTSARTGKPVDGATVRVQAQPGDRAGTGELTRKIEMTANSVANVYRYSLPAAGTAGWRITMAIDGPEGSGEAEFSAHGPEEFARLQPASAAPPGAPPLLLAAGAVAGMLLAAALTLPVRWVVRRVIRRG